MKKYSFLGAVVLAASALASPAMAQQVIYNPGYCAQFYPNANCQNLGPGNPYTGSYQRRAAYQQNYNRWDTGNPYTGGYQQRAAYQPTGWNTSYNRWDTGNTYTRGYQQRVAYQPTGWNTSYNRWDTGNPYTRGYQQSAAYQQTTAPYAAVDNGYRRGYYGQSYAQQSGLVCTPGTRYRGDDGRRHLCQ
jgi:hypothetical protein